MSNRGRIATDDEISAASREGLRGALVGAARWGIYSAAIGTAAYFFSPVYRGLTIQFKVFLQMSGMTAGSVIESERRMREYEIRARRMRKIKKDQEVWTRYENDFEEEDMGRTLEKRERQ